MPTPGHSQELQTPAPIEPQNTQDNSSLEEVKKRIEEMIAQLPELQKLKDQVLMEITGEGLRIELLEKENSHFFDIGSANLKPETRKILHLIAQELGRLPNRVAIEGHTDSRPYGSQGYTNWELSTDRANAARRFMDTAGLRPNQVYTVRGFSDRLLRNRQDPLDFQNRRVSIIVMFQDPESAVPQSMMPPKALMDGGDNAKAASLGMSSEIGAAALSAPSRRPSPNLPPAAPGEQNPTQSPGPDNNLRQDLEQELKPIKPQIRLGW